MTDIVLRPTEVLSYESCGYAVGLKRQGWRSEETGYSLCFGTAVHRAGLGWVQADAEGVAGFDAVGTYEETWARELEENIVKFSSRYSEQDLRRIGKALVERFVEVWQEERFQVYADAEGPFVERRLVCRVGPGVLLSLEPDVVAYDRFGRLSVLDLKTPAAASFEGFVEISDQLTAYQMGFEDQQDIPRVDRVGYVEALKQKSKTLVEVRTASRRSQQQVADYRRKVLDIAGDIAGGRFHKSPKMAFNSPCSLCEFQGLCIRNDPTGLVQQKKQRRPEVDFAAA